MMRKKMQEEVGKSKEDIGTIKWTKHFGLFMLRVGMTEEYESDNAWNWMK